LGAVARAPDVLRLGERIAAQNGVEKDVDGDVVQAAQVALEPFAKAAVRVLEHGHAALAVAAHDGE